MSESTSREPNSYSNKSNYFDLIYVTCFTKVDQEYSLYSYEQYEQYPT